ncbi:MAG: hypothetical protein PVG39_27795 [Desulfobacteraceae bacterium]
MAKNKGDTDLQFYLQYVNIFAKASVFKITGDLGFEEIIDLIDMIHSFEITSNILMDLSHGDTTSLTAKQIEKIRNYSKKYSHLRACGKTAYIVNSDVDYGLARMYQIHTELKGHEELHTVFRSMEEAMIWLNE